MRFTVITLLVVISFFQLPAEIKVNVENESLVNEVNLDIEPKTYYGPYFYIALEDDSIENATITISDKSLPFLVPVGREISSFKVMDKDGRYIIPADPDKLASDTPDENLMYYGKIKYSDEEISWELPKITRYPFSLKLDTFDYSDMDFELQMTETDSTGMPPKIYMFVNDYLEYYKEFGREPLRKHTTYFFPQMPSRVSYRKLPCLSRVEDENYDIRYRGTIDMNDYFSGESGELRSLLDPNDSEGKFFLDPEHSHSLGLGFATIGCTVYDRVSIDSYNHFPSMEGKYYLPFDLTYKTTYDTYKTLFFDLEETCETTEIFIVRNNRECSPNTYSCYTNIELVKASEINHNIFTTWNPEWERKVIDVEYIVKNRDDEIGALKLSMTTTGIDGTPVADENCRIYGDKGRVAVISSQPRSLNLYSIDGSLARILNVTPGENIFDDILPGIYIVNRQKIRVR